MTFGEFLRSLSDRYRRFGGTLQDGPKLCTAPAICCSSKGSCYRHREDPNRTTFLSLCFCFPICSLSSSYCFQDGLMLTSGLPVSQRLWLRSGRVFADRFGEM